MALLDEFKKFAMRGNVVDLAVGVVIGAGFGKIVTSFVNDILMPPLGLLLGGRNFGALAVTLVALVVQLREGVTDVPLREQGASAGGGVMNFLNAMHLMGYGAKTLSGASVDDPPVRKAFCREGEALLCWIVCGTPRERPRPRYADDLAAALEHWKGP